MRKFETFDYKYYFAIKFEIYKKLDHTYEKELEKDNRFENALKKNEVSKKTALK